MSTPLRTHALDKTVTSSRVEIGTSQHICGTKQKQCEALQMKRTQLLLLLLLLLLFRAKALIVQ